MIEYIFLGIFSIILFVIAVLMLRNRIIFKLGFRNILRRKGYTVIVIFGLMVGTGVISSSLVIGDTMNNMIETEILKFFYTTDEIIQGRKYTGEFDYFNTSIFYEYDQQIDKEFIDGMSPQIFDYVAILDVNTNLSEPMIEFIGVDFDHIEGFGSLINKKGEKITSLNDDKIMLGVKTAGELNAKVNDAVVIYVNNTINKFTIAHILQDNERAGGGLGIYTSLKTAQNVLKKADLINQILISNKGGIHEGMDYTDEVEDAFDEIEITDDLEFIIVQSKKDTLEEGKQGMEDFTNMFIVFGTFSIIAGIILIINIFVMLSEERKSEMGMERAIGMQRKHLKRMYLGEGIVYALIASLVGVIFGVGIGYLIIFFLEDILSTFGDINIIQYFTFTRPSIIIGFVAGFLITIFTIYLTSHRISKLNIVRAIRNIPEPKIPRSDKKMFVIGSLILIFGLFLMSIGVLTEKAAPFISGISLIVFGAGVISRRWIGDRIAFNLVGIINLIIWVLPSEFFPSYTGDIEMFIISGIFLVFSALLILMFNSDQIIKGITYLIGRGKSRQAVVKTAVSYALKSKFRTGMTIAIFALVIFTITTMSMIVGMFGTNIENQVQKASGGYEIVAFSNELSPIDDIEQALIDEGIAGKIEKIAAPLSGTVALNTPTDSNEPVYYTILGIDDNFIEENEFEFYELLNEYKNEKDAWNAIRNDNTLVIVDASIVTENEYGPALSFFTVKLGDTVELKDKDNNIVKKKVIGVLDTTFIRGIFTYNKFVEQEFGITKSTVFLFSVKDGEKADDVAKEIESAFLKNGMQAFAIKTLVMESINTMNQFFYLFDAFMALGLIIGIAGLGIITIRSVHERRQEIGMMRAIGFKKRMILSTFLIETSTISFLGIIIGTLLGIFTGYIIWRDSFQQLDFEFIINWQPIVYVAIAAFIFTVVCVIPASRKASKIPPAEALRYEG